MAARVLLASSLAVATLNPCSKGDDPAKPAASGGPGAVLSQDIRPIASAPSVVSSLAAAASIAQNAPKPVTPGRDVCKLVTNADVKTATAMDVADAKPTRSGNADVCTYTTAKGVSAIVQIYGVAGAYDESRRQFETLQKAKSEEVPGVGDKAFVVGGTIMGIASVSLSAQKGGTPISVQMIGGDAAKSKPAVIALAKTTLSKL
jgi:hypothetical protein